MARNSAKAEDSEDSSTILASLCEKIILLWTPPWIFPWQSVEASELTSRFGYFQRLEQEKEHGESREKPHSLQSLLTRLIAS